MKKQINEKIGEIMTSKLKGTKIPLHFIKEALLKQKTLKDNRLLGEILVTDGLIAEETISEALSIQYGLNYSPYISIKPRIIWDLYEKDNIVNKIPNLLALIKKSQSFPAFYDKIYGKINGEDECLVVVTTEPQNESLDLMILKLKELFKEKEIRIIVAPKYSMVDFELNIKKIRLEELIDKSNKITKTTNDELKAGEVSALDFLKYLLIFSIVEEASDIHIQPASNGYSRLSIRKQGILETLLYLPLSQMGKIVASIKNQSKLDSTIVKVPQDGRLDGKELLDNVKFTGSLSKEERVFDFKNVTFRVSTYPTEAPVLVETGTSFESVVMRILNPKSGLVRLEDLGLSLQVKEELEILKNRSQGIILITGPTGSGKSTTLYSALGAIDAISTKIITFEDPVELRQMFWAQGQKNISEENKNVNFDYASAIKAMMRQDPDVILLGEIREFEGADFAFKAANTGHMVFSTLHANSSCQAFERLRKIGVDDLMMASSILAVSAQRLVRRVCPHCAVIKNITATQKLVLEKLEIDKNKIPKQVTTSSENGCEKCNYKKYIGRLLISEVVPVNNAIREAIVDKEPDYKIRDLADKSGYKTIVEDGIDKLLPKKIEKRKPNSNEVVTLGILPGETTIEELLRVI